MHAFALFGMAVLAAWILYQSGVSNNSGGADKNNRYLADYKHSSVAGASQGHLNMDCYLDLVLMSKMYPQNAELIYQADKYGHHPHEAVVKNKESVSGISIHYVNEHYDEGDRY